MLPEQLEECLEKYDGEEWDNVPIEVLIKMCQEMYDKYPPTEADLREKGEDA